MSTYYCLLGNTPELSLHELKVLTANQAVELVSPQVGQIELADDAAAKDLMSRAGGTVKICRPIEVLPSSDPEKVEQAMVKFLKSLNQSKVTFGVAEVGRDHLPVIALNHIKKSLTNADISARYIESPRLGLSASVLLHQTDVIELVVLMAYDSWWLCQTVAIQDIDAWTKRDRSKPYSDRRKGMLPPKVARMMVNLGLGLLTQPSGEKPLVYDPFCGTGTVLMEAAMLGANVAGSDLDEDSVKGTQENLSWLVAEEKLTTQVTIFASDVSKARPAQIPGQVSCIVTEPFLGKATPRPDQLPGIFRGLEKLYLGAFRQWRQLLPESGVVVIVFPLVDTGKVTFSLETLIDKLRPLGYTIVSEPVIYRRPQAVVQRQIHIFKYQPES